MKLSIFPLLLVATAALIGLACSRQATPRNAYYQDSVKQALEQADLGVVRVDENADKNTITLKGTLHSQDDKAKAGVNMDRFRLRIWEKANGKLVYDSGLGGPENVPPTTAIPSGSVDIHREQQKPKKTKRG